MEREAHVMRIMFSIYMKEHFHYYVPLQFMHRNNHTHSLLLLQVQADELIDCWKYMMQLCIEKVPYNSTDLILCCMPGQLFSDVDSTTVPERVYCSQAMVLMLKKCIQTGRANAALVRELESMNSRSTSPMRLFHKLYAHCMQADVDRFVTGPEIVLVGK
jgi:hypothetical protein